MGFYDSAVMVIKAILIAITTDTYDVQHVNWCAIRPYELSTNNWYALILISIIAVPV